MFQGMHDDSAPAGPHSDAPPARFIEMYSPVYALVGGLLREEGAPDDAPFMHLVAPGVYREFEPFFLPMFTFFQTARTHQQALEWLQWAGAPDDALKDLIDTGVVVHIDTTSPLTAAASLKGIRIIPHAVPGEPAPDYPTQISVRRDADSPVVTYVSIELEHVLWGLDEPLDLPTVIESMANESGERHDLTARRVLTNVPRLLAQGLARLELVAPPQHWHLTPA